MLLIWLTLLVTGMLYFTCNNGTLLQTGKLTTTTDLIPHSVTCCNSPNCATEKPAAELRSSMQASKSSHPPHARLYLPGGARVVIARQLNTTQLNLLINTISTGSTLTVTSSGVTASSISSTAGAPDTAAGHARGQDLEKASQQLYVHWRILCVLHNAA